MQQQLAAPDVAKSYGRNLVAALALHFLTVAAIILARTLIDTIFLSTYPRAWLSYLYMGQTAAALALAFGARPIIASGSRVVSAGLLAFFAASMIGSRLLLAAGLRGVPFGVCLWLAAVSTMLGVLSWNVVGDAFDVRQFKRVAKWINASGTVGAMVFGALVPLLVRVVAPEALLYVLGGAVLLSMVCFVSLRLLPAASSGGGGSAKAAASPMRYPLFRRLALAAGLLNVVDTLSDYALKSELARRFDKRGIGSFMGPFYAISSALTLVAQFAATGPLLSAFGVVGLIGVLPVLGLAGGAVIAALPGLWPAAGLRMGQGVAGYSVNNIGREIAARPLPSAIRRAGKLYLKGVATPVGSGIGALLLFAVAQRVGLRGIAIGIAALAALWFVVVLRVKPAYEGALEQAVGMGRLGVELEDADEATLAAGLAMAEQGLDSDEEDVVLFSLELLGKLGSGEPPAALGELLAHDSGAVRAAAATATEPFDPDTVVPLLLERLRAEQSPEVLWQNLTVLARIGAERAVPHVEAWTRSPVAEVRAGAVLVLLEAGDLDGILAAATALKGMVASEDAAMRRGAAHAIGALRAGKLDKELRKLIDDPDESVAVAAMRAAAQRRAVGLIDALVGKLGYGPRSFYAGRALVALGADAVPALEARVVGVQAPAVSPLHRVDTAAAASAGAAVQGATAARRAASRHGSLALGGARAAVRVLMLVDDPSVDEAAARLFGHPDVPTRTTVAFEAAARARRLPEAHLRLRAAARTALGPAAEAVRVLSRASRSVQLVPGLIGEITARAAQATRRMLCFAAIASDAPGRVLDLAAAFEPGAGDRRAAALELLDALLDRHARPALAVLEDSGEAPPAETIAEQIGGLGDRWLASLMQEAFDAHATLGDGVNTMDIAQRVMLLRKVNLFSSLSGETLMTIAETSEVREALGGTAIFEKGDPPDGLYIVASGEVAIRKDARTKSIAKLVPGEFFGEIALIDDAPRMAGAFPERDGVLLFIDRESFRRLTEDLPEVLRAVVRTLIAYLKLAEQQTGERTMY